MMIDWRRISRWCLLLAIAMGVWLMVPTVRCSIDVFRDAPIGETSQDVQQMDKTRVKEGVGFWERLGSGAKACYRAHPPLSQERWKRNVLVGLLALMTVAWVIDRIEKRRKRTYAK